MDGAPGGENCLGVRRRLVSGACRNRAQIVLRALPGTVRPILGVSKYRHHWPTTRLSSNAPACIWQTGCNTTDQRAFPLGASSPALSYLSGHSYPASMHAIRSQLRCDPDSRSDVHTLLFHRISYSVRPMDTPPCRMLFLFSHMLWVMPIAKQLYIQNEGLSDIFCRNAKFCANRILVSLSIDGLVSNFVEFQLIGPRRPPLCKMCLLFRLVTASVNGNICSEVITIQNERLSEKFQGNCEKPAAVPAVASLAASSACDDLGGRSRAAHR